MKHTTLPASPVGWSAQFLGEISRPGPSGRIKARVFQLFDADKAETPIGLSVAVAPTRGPLQYTVEGVDEIFPTWAAVVEAWPRVRAAAAAWMEKGEVPA